MPADPKFHIVEGSTIKVKNLETGEESVLNGHFDVGIQPSAEEMKEALEFDLSKQNFITAQPITMEFKLEQTVDWDEFIPRPVDIVIMIQDNYQYDSKDYTIACRVGDRKYRFALVINNDAVFKAHPQSMISHIEKEMEKALQKFIHLAMKDGFKKPTLLEICNKWQAVVEPWRNKLSEEIYAVSEYVDQHNKDYFDVPAKAHELPGTNTFVKYPCHCDDLQTNVATLYRVIIHLNDKHHPKNERFKKNRWSRERIADWIDELHDDGIINAEFSPWEDTLNGNDIG